MYYFYYCIKHLYLLAYSTCTLFVGFVMKINSLRIDFLTLIFIYVFYT